MFRRLILRAVRASKHSFTGRSWKLPVIKKNENQPAPIMTLNDCHHGGGQGTVDGLQEKRLSNLVPYHLVGQLSRVFQSERSLLLLALLSPAQGDGAKIRIFFETCFIAGWLFFVYACKFRQKDWDVQEMACPFHLSILSILHGRRKNAMKSGIFEERG